MGHFEHAPAPTEDRGDTPELASRRARYGLVLFAIYFLLYAGFLLLNVVDPGAMEQTPLAGLNVAILYGFGLIVAALALALVYAWLCREREAPR